MDVPPIHYTKTTDGVSIAYWTLGSGPALVFMDLPYSHIQVERTTSGYGEAGEVAARVVTFIRYDHRGFGLSDREVDDFSIEALVTDLEAVVDKLGLARFWLVANRMTSPIGIAYCARHPERVSRVVLELACSRPPEVLLDQVQAVLDVRHTDWRFASEALTRLVMGWDDDEAATSLAALLREAIDFDSFRRFWNCARDWNADDLVGRVRCPALLMSWRGHWAFNEQLAKELAGRMLDARVALVDSADSKERGRQAMSAMAPFLGGANASVPRVVSAPVLTVLFTDLVGHTEMMSRLGDERGRDVLREHERITREVLKAHGGTEVKTMGDGFMASFGSVTKAVECAVALQRAFAEREGERLSVRVGLNAGEPIEEDGDLFGATVILASRIAAKAGAGEILVADTVRGLCSGKGLIFADRGEFVAKGFEEPMRIYEVSWRE